jgi:phage terminase large subunit-like protein
MDRPGNIIRFIETLRLPDGTMAGEPVVLRPWQKEIIRGVYGPCNELGKRLVKQAVLSLARKNGKTAIVSFLTLAHLCGPEAVRNGQLYSLSVDREQAGILFNYAKNVVYMDEELSERLNVIESRKQIVDPVSGSVYYVLSGEKKGKMGKSSSFIAFDELAEFGADRTLYDALLTSTGAHDQPMVWTFSTQSPDNNAVMSELIDYGKKIQAGDITDPTFKMFLYEIPENMDVFDEKNWHLANPALGDFRSIDELRDYAEKAKAIPSMESTLRNLYANQRADPTIKWISRATWEACECELNIDAYRGRECFGGLDLSFTADLTALAWVFPSDDGFFDAFVDYWKPGEGIKEAAKQDRVPYDLWAKQGYLRLTGGRVIKLEPIADRMAEIASLTNLKDIAYDRYRHRELEDKMSDMGVTVPMIEHPQGFRRLGLVRDDQGNKVTDSTGKPVENPLWMPSSVQYLENLLIEQKIRIAFNPVLKWNVANTVIRDDPAGTDNKIFDKRKSTARIDGVVALAMAVGLAMAKIKMQSESVYSTRGVLTF